MVEGFFGGPRPLLSMECFLVIRDYTALPSPTISGGTSPDRSDEFREAAQNQLPVDSFFTEPHDMAPDLFGEYLVAELEGDRLQLNQFMAFVEEYAVLLDVDDLREVNVGIDARTVVDSSVPRPFVADDVAVVLLLEIRFPSEYQASNVGWVATQLGEELGWVAEATRTGSDTAVLQHHSGPNDLVVTQALGLVDELKQYEIPLEGVTVTCSTTAARRFPD